MRRMVRDKPKGTLLYSGPLDIIANDLEIFSDGYTINEFSSSACIDPGSVVILEKCILWNNVYLFTNIYHIFFKDTNQKGSLNIRDNSNFIIHDNTWYYFDVPLETCNMYHSNGRSTEFKVLNMSKDPLINIVRLLGPDVLTGIEYSRGPFVNIPIKEPKDVFKVFTKYSDIIFVCHR